MSLSCVAAYCTNQGTHLFPKDAKKRKLWEEAVNRKNWRSGRYSKLCSAHFRQNDYSLLSEYNGSVFTRKVLKRTAVPSLFSLEPLPSADQCSDTEHLESKSNNATSGKNSKCAICNKLYANAQILNEHIKSVHQLSNLCSKNRVDICQFCLQRFPTESDLEAHLVQMRFPCLTCKKCFGSDKELATHELTELTHPTLPQFSCHVCGEQFEENFALTSHMRKHSTMKSYVRKKPKLTGVVSITDHRYDKGQTATGSEATTGTVNRITDPTHMGQKIISIDEATNLTGAVGRITDQSTDTGQSMAMNEVKVKMEQNESEPQNIWIEVEVKREPDEVYTEPLDQLEAHVKTELNMSLGEYQENVHMQKEAGTEEVKTEDIGFGVQVKQKPEENGSERTF